MRFFVKDVPNNLYIGPFETRESLILWWNSKCGQGNFSELNVTGCDRSFRRVPTGTFSYVSLGDGKYLPVRDYHTISTLRRYQVVDEMGRSIDIRSWPDSILTYQPPRRSCYWGQSGSRPHGHRASGPSMHRNTIRNKEIVVDLDELIEEGLPLPKKSSCQPRKKVGLGKIDSWDYYEEVHHKHYACSKAWKDQHKTRRQWGKHMPGLSRVHSNEEERKETLFSRLAADGLPVML